MAYQRVTRAELNRWTGPRPGVRAFHDAVLWVRHSAGVRSGGIYNRRRVRGGSSWSLHSVGRAADFMVPNLAAGYDIAFRAIRQARMLGVSEVIQPSSLDRRARHPAVPGLEPAHRPCACRLYGRLRGPTRHPRPSALVRLLHVQRGGVMTDLFDDDFEWPAAKAPTPKRRTWRTVLQTVVAVLLAVPAAMAALDAAGVSVSAKATSLIVGIPAALVILVLSGTERMGSAQGARLDGCTLGPVTCELPHHPFAGRRRVARGVHADQGRLPVGAGFGAGAGPRDAEPHRDARQEPERHRVDERSNSR